MPILFWYLCLIWLFVDGIICVDGVRLCCHHRNVFSLTRNKVGGLNPVNHGFYRCLSESTVEDRHDRICCGVKNIDIGGGKVLKVSYSWNECPQPEGGHFRGARNENVWEAAIDGPRCTVCPLPSVAHTLHLLLLSIFQWLDMTQGLCQAWWEESLCSTGDAPCTWSCDIGSPIVTV